MKRLVGGLLAIVFLTGCHHQQASSSKSQTPHPLVPVSISSVAHLTIDTYVARNLNHPVSSVNITSISKERKLIDEIDSSKSVPLPTAGTTVSTPPVRPNSTSYKVTVWLKNGTTRIFKVGFYGPTYDVVFKEDISPGFSRNVLQKLSPNTKQK